MKVRREEVVEGVACRSEVHEGFRLRSLSNGLFLTRQGRRDKRNASHIPSKNGGDQPPPLTSEWHQGEALMPLVGVQKPVSLRRYHGGSGLYVHARS